MNDDAIAQLRRAISAPGHAMTVVTVASTQQTGKIISAVAESLHPRPWGELPLPCTEGVVGRLLKTARQLTETWPNEEGVLFLSDHTPPNRPPQSGVEFWRAMNLQRENWAGLNCHLVFLLTLQNYQQLLTAADHLASWMAIKLDARRRDDARISDEFAMERFSLPSRKNREEARQRLMELERGLRETLQDDDEAAPTLLLRRYYLPMLEAALDANDLDRAESIANNINPDDVPDPDKPRWWQVRCNVLIRLFRFDEARIEAEKYLQWAQCSQNIQEEGNACIALGEILRMSGNFNAARAYLEQALEIMDVIYGKDHSNVATVANYFGLLLWDLGELREAKNLFEQAITILENIHGPNHPNVSTVINNLAGVLRDLGDLEEARAYYERSLCIDKAAYGPDHPTISRDLNNLGLVLRDMGDLEGAWAHFERAMKIDEETYGPDTPGVAVSLVNLGKLLWQSGNLSDARAHLERALRIDETTFGPDHPNVGRDTNNLGAVFLELGDLEKARVYIERALKIDETAYGPDHPNVARDVKNLGMVLQALGDLAAAREHYERAVAIYRRFFGDDHPTTKSYAGNLAALEE